MKHLIFLTIFIVLLAGCRDRVLVNNPEEKISVKTHNKILYYKGNDQYATNSALYMMDINGKENICLTWDMGGLFYDAKVSPDRSKIAFTLSTGGFDTYTSNWDGSNKICLNNVMLMPRFPVFSPLGDKLLFSSMKSGESGIYIVNADGTKFEKLTKDNADYKFPVFMSGGNSIAYLAVNNGSTDLYTFDLLRDKTVRLTTDGTVFPAAPEISPDEKTILFSSYTSYKNEAADIYTIDINDSNRKKLTNGGLNVSPRFSFDGSKIVYLTFGYTTCNINVMDKEGKNVKKLATIVSDTRGSFHNPKAVFTPDGNSIVFSGFDGSSVDIYIVNVDATGLKKLTNDTFLETVECTF